MLPQAAMDIIKTLNTAGFEAYAVGGCVRDMLRGITPTDIDITTSALPGDVMSVFSAYRVIPTGLKHGTVTVFIEDDPFEITTYRCDGAYSDHRHPDAVHFTTSLKDDLARRDFTVNAMAYHPDSGIIDPFGGERDLQAGILRCVGNAAKRFEEDALRIARLVRFMSVLDFEAEDNTAAAAKTLCSKLDHVAVERKRIELVKMLMGDGFLRISMQFDAPLCQIVPVLSPLRGFDQRTPYHDFDVYEHTMRAVQAAPKDLITRLALLFHDIGKPATFSIDERGIGHFYGHAAVSESLACEAMTALRFDNATIHAVLPLIHHHGSTLTPDKRCIRRRLSQLGKDGVRRLIDIKRADAQACHESTQIPDYSEVYQTLVNVLSAKDCVSLSMLAVNGHDLIRAGYTAGPLIGEILKALLDDVISDKCENTRKVLMCRVKEVWGDV